VRQNKVSDLRIATAPCTDEEWLDVLQKLVRQEPQRDIEATAEMVGGKTLTVTVRKRVGDITVSSRFIETVFVAFVSAADTTTSNAWALLYFPKKTTRSSSLTGAARRCRLSCAARRISKPPTSASLILKRRCASSMRRLRR
jgi:hypothetical protein